MLGELTMHYSLLGKKLRQLRENMSYSQKQVAELSGLSCGFISQVERDQVDPSLASLKKLANALGVKLKDLFDDEEQFASNLVRKGQGNMLQIDDAVTCELLAATPDKIMEPMIKYVSPGGESGIVSPHEGEEFIWVISGTLQVIHGKETYILNAGDSVYFQAGATHSWKNIGDIECKAIWVMTPPAYS